MSKADPQVHRHGRSRTSPAGCVQDEGAIDHRHDVDALTLWVRPFLPPFSIHLYAHVLDLLAFWHAWLCLVCR